MHIAAVHSVFDKEALFNALAAVYDIGTPISTTFVSNGLNDTYLVKTEKGPFILRIYKKNWRSESEIRFELDLLLYLIDCGIPLSYPIARTDGELLTELDAPEGLRYAVLFTHADGKGNGDLETSRRYGHSIALLHQAMDNYVPKYERFVLDTTHLLDEPLKQILPSLKHRPDDTQFVTDLSSRLKERILDSANDSLDWGVCHGDLHGWNVFHSEDGSLTHFDFDCCGLGWRSYDLSVFLWDRVCGRSEKDELKDECWDAFIEAYVKERPLSELDLGMIPVFIAARQLWLMGLHTGNSGVWGAWQDDGYFDNKINFLKAWVKEHNL
ncbi:Ser/Thr protein kinase RdoA (MazF antagonist) [Paenibacillus castaneae]|uniref:phosphotransferase enzyme family protein n=1 Tax=Paenibacillus castaneae TaxID=474957 RepID=UPI00141B0CED|nr:phosphotransferase [Paenibacillus castaneae]NIK80020.1 Ser/Thr protein kinase RdoA (MazF antagonist) [Paenibacillus castaneae]